MNELTEDFLHGTGEPIKVRGIMTNPFSIYVNISEPYVNADGKLVVKITVCDESFEREITGQKDDDGGWILKEV